MASSRKRSAMTDEHKAALASGRAQGLVVRRYLESLERSKPKRGRRPSISSLERQLTEIGDKLPGAEPLRRLHLIQQRKSIEERLSGGNDGGELLRLEGAFVEIAAVYGARKRIDYSTWREAGVPVEVLRRAGIHRSAGS